MKILIIILARKGSKRLKNKNLRKIGRESLVIRTIRFAKRIKFAKNIILSTDSDKIISISQKHCICLKRPSKLSTSTSTSADAAIHAIKYYENNYSKINAVLLLQPTTPYRKMKDIYKAIQLYKKNKTGVMSVTKYESEHGDKKYYYTILKNKLKKIMNKNLDNVYFANGSIYLTDKKYLLKNKDFQREKCFPVIINTKKFYLDIDYLKDLNEAKKYI